MSKDKKESGVAFGLWDLWSHKDFAHQDTMTEAKVDAKKILFPWYSILDFSITSFLSTNLLCVNNRGSFLLDVPGWS